MSLKTNGTARFKNIQAFYSWYEQLSIRDGEERDRRYTALLKEHRDPSNTRPWDIMIKKSSDMFAVTGWASYPAESSKEYKWPKAKEKNLDEVKRFVTFCQAFEQTPNVLKWMDEEFAFLYLGNPNRGIFVPDPEQYLEFIPDQDFSELTPGQVRASLNMPRTGMETNLIPVENELQLSPKAMTQHLADNQSELDGLEAQMEAVKKAETEELSKLQQEIDRKVKELENKKQALLADLNRKKEELEEKMEQMQGQIYLLESQIYAIRCYAGEVVQFAKIRSGKNASNEEPITIHQKLRFLDEDLGRLASLYEIQWNQVGLFEEFLRHSPLALDTFAPNERCVVLVRISRTAQVQAADDKRPFMNMLKDYDYFHGRTVGIIIRNGENLYLGWTEEEKVHIDDDLIISQVITDVQPAEPEPRFVFESEKKAYIQKKKKEQRDLMDGIISRAFIYNILQGVVDHSPLLPLPKGVKLSKQSPYVIYAVADRWLSDNRFESFPAIIKDCNKKVSAGDTLLTVQRLVPENMYYGSGYNQSRAWNNVRGRGEANRTHDCVVHDCTLYPASLVEYDEPVKMIRYRRLIKPFSLNGTNQPAEWKTFALKESDRKHIPDDAEILEEYEYSERHVFVSAKKMDDWNYVKPAFARFELNPEEFINLTYMNSVWLEWVITNKTLGNWTVGGQSVNYAYAIRYLKTAMDYVRKRETEEKTLIAAIDKTVCLDADWPLKLTEWKMKAGIRSITEFQAKRFVKHIKGTR